MEELSRLLGDPLSPAPLLPSPLRGSGGGWSDVPLAGGAAAGAPGLAQFVPVPGWALDHASVVQRHSGAASYFPGLPAIHTGSSGGYGATAEESPHPLLRPATLHIRAGSQPAAAGYGDGGSGSSRGSLASLKRRVVELGLSEGEDQASPHGGKRHSSSSSAWSEGTADSGGYATTPRSGGGAARGAGGPSRLGFEQGQRQRPGGSSSYGESRQRSHAKKSAARPAQRQQQQRQHAAAAAEEEEQGEEEQAARPQQYRGMSRHRWAAVPPARLPASRAP